MINLDPSLIDQDKKRKERRRHLLKVSALPIVFLLVIAVFFLSTCAYNIVYSISYNNKNYPIANDVTETRFLLNVLEPYISDYNQGVSSMMMGDFEKAEKSFEKSLENNPPEDKQCKIYENLSLSIEKQADEKLGGGVSYGDAIDLYSRAEALLYAKGCAGRNGADGRSYKSDVARDRIIEKREDAVNALNKSADDGDSSIDESRKKDITKEDLEKNKDNIVSPDNKALGVGHIVRDVECKVENGDKCW